MTDSGGRVWSGWFGGSAAMLVLAALGSGAPAIAASPDGFAPPASRLLLTRTLSRALAGGKAVTTRRSYDVRILRDGDGYRVEGRLIEATVDAPPSLAALAAIERQRTDEGLFPIMLDARGMIVGGGAGQSGESLEHAAAIAAQRIGIAGLPAPEIRAAQSFIAQLQASSPRSQWPADVFHPQPGRRREQRAVTLPGGGEGNITIEIAGNGPGTSGQIAALERIVTTQLGGDRRMTREHWQLSRTPEFSER